MSKHNIGKSGDRRGPSGVSCDAAGEARPARSGKNFTKPTYWTNEPLPEPDKGDGTDSDQQADPTGPSPTRYGDWVVKGIAVDF